MSRHLAQFAFVATALLLFTQQRHLVSAEDATRTLNLTHGLAVHVDTLRPLVANASLLARHALRLTYNALTMRLAADDASDTYRMSVYHDEGRGRKDELSEIIIPALLGYKTSALTFVLLFGMLALVVKALTIANVAVMVAAALWARRLFGGAGIMEGKTSSAHSIGFAEYDNHASDMQPVYAEYPGDISELGYAQTAAGNYIAYGDGNAAESVGGDGGGALSAGSDQHFSYVEAPQGGANVTMVQRRRAGTRKPLGVHTYLTVRRKSAH